MLKTSRSTDKCEQGARLSNERSGKPVQMVVSRRTDIDRVTLTVFDPIAGQCEYHGTAAQFAQQLRDLSAMLKSTDR